MKCSVNSVRLGLSSSDCSLAHNDTSWIYKIGNRNRCSITGICTLCRSIRAISIIIKILSWRVRVESLKYLVSGISPLLYNFSWNSPNSPMKYSHLPLFFGKALHPRGSSALQFHVTWKIGNQMDWKRIQ